MISKNKIFLILIILIACILRFWQLGVVPPSPDWDEAALGYNAYSIKETGKDEYGVSYPIILRSFDDYKPALYTYFIIPFITLFDLNIISVRLPSVIFGILTVVATYFMLRELFRDSRFKLEIPEVATLLLAVSPWHIQFSRIAFESNVGLAFNVFTALFFLKGLKKPMLLIIAAIFAGLNLYIYQGEKVFTPLLILILIILFRNKLFQIPKKYLATAFVIGAIISFPFVLYTLTNTEALTRAKGVSIFSDQTQLLKQTTDRLIEDKNNNDFLGLVLDNRRIVFVKSVVVGYLSHFDFNWLFITGDIARHHAPSMGLLYIFELPFLLIGMYCLLFRTTFDKKTKLVIFFWFLAAPIPASITSGVPHAVRTLNFLPTFQVFTAIGIISTLQRIFPRSGISLREANIPPSLKLRRVGKYFKFFIVVFIFSFFIFNFLYYVNQYFVQQNYFNSKEWQYGYKQAAEEVKKIGVNFEKIIVSNKPHLDQSYIFFLFYLKYPPQIYQEESIGASGGFKENHIFGKFEFRPIVWEKEKKSSNILYIGRPEDFSETAEVIKTIYFLDGKPAIKIVKE